MNNMITINATDVRRDWSAVVDSVVREKPRFIKRTRDYMFLSDIKILENILSVYKFTAETFTEDDGSITISLNEIDLVDNGKDEKEAKFNLAKQIIEYAEIFYEDFDDWASAVNTKVHIPHVFKALIINDADIIGGLIQCQPGKN